MKRPICVLLSCALALTLGVLPAPARAAGAPTVLLDGLPLSFDVPPAVAEGRVLVPFRVLFEALGFQVDWDGAGGITAVSPGRTVVLALGEAEMTVDGRAVALDAAPRAVAEASGCTVLWD